MGLLGWPWGQRGPSGFDGSSTAEEVTAGVDASHLTAIVTGLIVIANLVALLFFALMSTRLQCYVLHVSRCSVNRSKILQCNGIRALSMVFAKKLQTNFSRCKLIYIKCIPFVALKNKFRNGFCLVKHRSNKWHWEGDGQSSCTEGSESDHSSKNTGEWPEGEGEPCRAGPRLESACHGDGPELSQFSSQLRTVLQLVS